jgi:hypothetical protein
MPGVRTTSLFGISCCVAAVLWISVAPVEAQNNYSANSRYIKKKSEGNNVLNQFRDAYPDTSVNFFHQYDPRNFLGNVGLPSPQYQTGLIRTETGFRVCAPVYPNSFSEQDVQYYSTLGPYADLTGIAGTRELQMFKLLFTVTYAKRLNLTARFNRHTSLGFYNKQQSALSNFYFTANSVSKKRNAGFYIYGLFNGNKNQENGGIRNFTLNDSTMELHKDIMRVRINNATRDNRETRLMFNPWLRIIRKKNDTISSAGHYLQLKTRAMSGSLQYVDKSFRTDTLYKLAYFDTTTTKDSTHFRQITNEISYVFLRKSGRGFSLGYRHELGNVWQYVDSIYSNHLVMGDISFGKTFDAGDTTIKTKAQIDNRLSARYVLQGANVGDYLVENEFHFRAKGSMRGEIFANAILDRKHPDFIFNRWVSNHFQWNNHYRSYEQVQAQAGWRYSRKFGISAYYRNIFRYLYFDAQAMPQQYQKTIEVGGANLFFDLVALKHIGLSAQYTQQFSSQQSVLPLPSNILRANLFYTGNHFHNSLQIRVGAQLEIYDSFYSYGYMPATQAFYVQDRISTKRYPFLDLYLNARIRPVMVFLKIENALYGYAGNSYFFTPGYYQTDLAFRFGISWVFFD